MKKRLLCLTLLALSAYGRDWLPCVVKSGERFTKPASNTVNVGRQSVGGILADRMTNRATKIWGYAIEAGEQVYIVESKGALDIDIDAETKYSRKGGTFYLLDRNGKEKSLKIVRQMSREDAIRETN